MTLQQGFHKGDEAMIDGSNVTVHLGDHRRVAVPESMCATSSRPMPPAISFEAGEPQIVDEIAGWAGVLTRRTKHL